MSPTTPDFLAWHGWGFGPAAFTPLRAALCDRAQLNAPALSAPDGNIDAWAARLAPGVTGDQILIGWSLGGMLALAAVAAGARPRGLVLLATSPRFVATSDWPHALDQATVTAFRDGFSNAPARTLQRFLALQTLGDARRGAVQDTLAHAGQSDVTGLAPALDVLIAADLRARVSDIRLPTLILHGEQDALMPVGAAEWLAGQLPHATLQRLARCGHAPHVSRAEAVADALLAFAGALPDA